MHSWTAKVGRAWWKNSSLNVIGCIDGNQASCLVSKYDVFMKPAWIFVIVGVLTFSCTRLAAWSEKASGFTLTEACGAPPFGAGLDMHLHLRRFPQQKAGQELVLDIPSLLGPSGVKDWMDVPAHLCTVRNPTTCSDAQSARVQVLNYSGRYYPFIRNWLTKPTISGNFEVNLKDGSSIKAPFTATAHRMRYSQHPTCE